MVESSSAWPQDGKTHIEGLGGEKRKKIRSTLIYTYISDVSEKRKTEERKMHDFWIRLKTPPGGIKMYYRLQWVCTKIAAAFEVGGGRKREPVRYCT